MRVFSKKMLREFWEQHAEAKTGLQGWYEEALRVEWQTPLDIKQSHANASIIADNRVVFNIQGNAYRLIVKVHYDRGFIYIRFVGTHDEYNRINAETI